MNIKFIDCNCTLWVNSYSNGMKQYFAVNPEKEAPAKVKPSPSNPKPKWRAIFIGFLIKELVRILWEIIKDIFS